MIVPYVSSTACDNGEDDACPEMKYSQLSNIENESEITETFENECFELISEYLSYEDTHFFINQYALYNQKIQPIPWTKHWN